MATITPNSIILDGDSIIQLTGSQAGVWTSDVGAFFTDSQATIPYDGTSAVSSIYFKPINRTVSGSINMTPDATASVSVIGIFPAVPHYPLDWEGDKRGVVLSLTRSGKPRGRIEGTGEYMRDYKLVFQNRKPWEIDEIEAFHAFHHPHRVFKYRNKWNNVEGFFRFDSRLKAKAESLVKGNFEVAISQVPYELAPTIESVATDNTPPSTPANFQATSPTPTSVVCSWNASSDNIAVKGYKLEIDGVEYDVGNLTVVGTTVAAGSSHRYRVKAYDAAGNESAWSVMHRITTANTDSFAPRIEITSPAGGERYYGESVPLSVSVSDPNLVGVQWMIGGDSWGAEKTIAPYSGDAIDTTSLPAGEYTITAIARDSAGNKASHSVRVYFNPNPDTENPTVSWHYPVPSQVVSDTIQLQAVADDNDKVQKIDYFYYDGSGFPYIGSSFTAPYYPVNFDTTGVPNGTLTLSAIAFDQAGNPSTADFVTVVVNN